MSGSSRDHRSPLPLPELEVVVEDQASVFESAQVAETLTRRWARRAALVGQQSFDAVLAARRIAGVDRRAARRDREDGRRAAAVGGLGEQRVVFVNATSASGEFAKALAGPSRALLLATRSGAERNQTEFGRFFVEALAGDGADADKDGRVSLQEAFDYAKRETERAYEKDKRLLTEHATLVDATGLAKAAYLAGGSSTEPATRGRVASSMGGTEPSLGGAPLRGPTCRTARS